MKIAIVFNRDREDTTGMYLLKALRRSSHRVHHYCTERADAIPPIYDWYLRIDHGDYKFDIPDHLRPNAFYAIDTHLPRPFEKIQRQARHYDLVFCAQKEGVAKLHRAANVRAHWLPVACDPQVHRPLPVQKRFDFGFVGTTGKKNPRGDYLALIAERFPNSRLTRTRFSRMSRVYARSKIGFNYSIANDINMRMFEVMASGTMLLTNALQDNGLEEMFQEGRDFVRYRDQEEFLALAQKYLADDAEREKIARAGYRRVIANHTYRHRVAGMLDIARRELLGRYAGLSA